MYELFTLDPSVSKKFPKFASPRLYLDIFFQIYGWDSLLHLKLFVGYQL
jgi:hypothetical protein